MTTPSASSAAPSELPPSGDVGLPSQGVRTTVNLLLFVHLFSLGMLCVFNGSEMGLRQQLRRVPGYYLQLLGMDLDFDSGQRFNWELQSRDTRLRLKSLRENLVAARDGHIHEAEKDFTILLDLQKQNPRNVSRRGLYHLTHADVLDVGHFLQFSYTRDGESRVIGLPSFHRGSPSSGVVAAWPSTVGWQGFWPRQRYLRYQMLAREVGRLAGTESVQDILPAAIVEGLLRSEAITLDELGKTRPKLSCQRLTTRSQEQAAAAGEPTAEAFVKNPWDDRWFQPAYDKVPVAVGGRIRFSDTGGLQRDYTPAVEESPASKSRL